MLLAAVGCGPSAKENASNAERSCVAFGATVTRLTTPRNLAAIDPWAKAVDSLWDDNFRPAYKDGPAYKAFHEARFSPVSLRIGGEDAAGGDAESAAARMAEYAKQSTAAPTTAAALGAPACNLVGFRRVIAEVSAVASAADRKLTPEQRYLNFVRHQWRYVLEFTHGFHDSPKNIKYWLDRFEHDVYEREPPTPAVAGTRKLVFERVRSLRARVDTLTPTAFLLEALAVDALVSNSGGVRRLQ